MKEDRPVVRELIGAVVLVIVVLVLALVFGRHCSHAPQAGGM